MAEPYPYEVSFHAQLESESAYLSRLEYCVSRRLEHECNSSIWRFANQGDASRFTRQFGGVMSRRPDQ